MNFNQPGYANSRHIWFLSLKKTETANKIQGTSIQPAQRNYFFTKILSKAKLKL